jgi:uncharacterized protein (TIGR01777 family)
MNILIAGGRGFLGQALADRLAADGHRTLTLTRGRTTAGQLWQHARGELTWDPDGTAGSWAAAVEGADAVVNLAGESIAGGRWSAARKQAILLSRVLATRSLELAIAQATRRPAVFVSASAQGYYGDRGDEELTEEAAPGSDFLAGVCWEWETEARKAEARTRVVLLRTGIVLAAGGGALPRMLLPFKLFAGGPLGSGRQFMSWIHLDDWVGIACQAIGDERVKGARNLGSPRPVRNRDFSAALGRAMNRPSLLPAPAAALRLALGEMARPLLLASTRMIPAGALSDGYRFKYEQAADALGSLV